MRGVNETHDPGLKSWVQSANVPGNDFPIQNLPFGVFSEDAAPPRVGVAIGDQILDLTALETRGDLRPAGAGAVFADGTLNPFMALGPEIWSSTRRRLSELLRDDVGRFPQDAPMVSQAKVQMHLPIAVTEFTDFYASYEHAMNVGRIFRGDAAALVPNWLHMPIGYNGRASTVVVSGTPIHRPMGQVRPDPEGDPVFKASAKLDFEVELGAIVGCASEMGTRLTPEQAQASLFGFVLLNDWSARDIQLWEYQPLGPFQSKAFGTTISPWVVTCEAMEPFRVAPPERKQALLAHLQDTENHGYDIEIDVFLAAGGDKAHLISRTNTRHLYYTAAAQLTHHASSGCSMRVGDLLGSGTISGTAPESLGCLLELTRDGQAPLDLAGRSRGFLEDGDVVTFRGASQGAYRVGFGACSGRILPAT